MREQALREKELRSDDHALALFDSQTPEAPTGREGRHDLDEAKKGALGDAKGHAGLTKVSGGEFAEEGALLRAAFQASPQDSSLAEAVVAWEETSQ